MNFSGFKRVRTEVLVKEVFCARLRADWFRRIFLLEFQV